MLDVALKSKIPVISIQTDDLVNVTEVLQSIATGKTLAPVPTNKMFKLGPNHLYWTTNEEDITAEVYKQLDAVKTSAVIINGKKSDFAFDAGVLEVPSSLIRDRLQHFVPPDKLEGILNALKGLSIKRSMEIVGITMAKTGELTVKALNVTRRLLEGEAPGLESLDTNYPFYLPSPELEEWVDLNRDYFLDPTVPLPLIPRGVMLSGTPGVGKSMAAKYLAREWGVPLFRLDLVAALSKYIGESEHHIARVLRQVEDASPCILLIDEVDKLFGEEGGNGTTLRILNQLLWWLQYHTSRVITVMTTNNIKVIPPELYRPGRIDQHINVPMLTPQQAKQFVVHVYKSIDPNGSLHKIKTVRDAVDWNDMRAHSDVQEVVFNLVKSKGWLKDKNHLTNAIG